MQEVNPPGRRHQSAQGRLARLKTSNPPSAGLEGTFDFVEEVEEKPSIESFKVIGHEQVGAGVRGQVTAWKVLVDRPGQCKMTFWLTKVPPYIIKLQYSLASRPDVWNWNMI